MNELPLNFDIIENIPEHNLSISEINSLWFDALENLHSRYKKIIILDDDPTGSQTVYDLPVYTGLDTESLKQALNDKSQCVYLLTNSRSLSPDSTEQLHRELSQNLKLLAEDKELLIISRSDSTLRGHYPLETSVLSSELLDANEEITEILIPFFPEGGRYTYNDIHYVKEGCELVPASLTEFARDSSFPFNSSNLKEYVQEKSEGKINSSDVISVSLDDLRKGDILAVTSLLLKGNRMHPVIVNAVSYDDLKIFLCAFSNAVSQGRKFIFRSAAAFVRCIAGLEEHEILKRSQLLNNPDLNKPGLIIAGSYVGKTRRQLEVLNKQSFISPVAFDVRSALKKDSLKKEIFRCIKGLNSLQSEGKTPCLYTENPSGNFLSASESSENLSDLALSARISSALVEIVKSIEFLPSYIITKGGITSHDIAVHSLGIQRAMVLGQIAPGIPVWRCGAESRFPGIPLVIFPGNVGEDDTLASVASVFIEQGADTNE